MFIFCDYASFYGEDLSAHCPTPKLEDQPLSAVPECTVNIFTVSSILEAIPPSATREHAMPW